MKQRVVILSVAAAVSVLSLSACKRGARPTQESPIAAAIPPMIGASMGAPAAPVAPNFQPPVAPVAAADPLWPAWLPVIPGVRRRLNTSAVFGGVANENVLPVLVRTRQTMQAQGYTLSDTSVRRQPWEERFVFTATRGAEFVRLELVSQTARPMSTEVGATSGSVARSMMRRRV